jgi:hypothetical protein
MTERFFLLIGGLSSKAFAMLVTSCSAFLGLVFGEAMTNDLGRAGIAGAVATGLAAVFLVIPRIMEQRRKSRESAAKLNADSIALLMKAHDRDIDFYKSEIAALKLERALLIDAKHKAVGEWTASFQGYMVLVGQLRGLGQKPEIELQPAKYLDIAGEADETMKQVAAARVANGAPQKPA